MTVEPGALRAIEPFYRDDWLTVYQGDCREVLPTLPEASVDCVVTSPPYWSLRDYGVEPTLWGGDPEHDHEWAPQSKSSGGIYLGKSRWQHQHNGRGEEQPGERRQRPFRIDGHPEVAAGSLCACGAWYGALGLEPTPELYVEHLIDVMRAVWRVLSPKGTLWLNLGDCYATGGGRAGLKAKDRVGLPHRVVFALQAGGWWWRDEIVWSKPNPMPSSVRDRTTMAHEFLFLLTKAERYHYDGDAIREVSVGQNDHDHTGGGYGVTPPGQRPQSGNRARYKMPDGWATHPGSHGSIHRDGREKGAGPDKQTATGEQRVKGGDQQSGFNARWDAAEADGTAPLTRNRRSVWTIGTAPYPDAHFATFPPALVEPCILAGTPPGGTVLDPFAGTGTVGMVAQSLSRRAILIDANPEYLRQSLKRVYTRARVSDSMGLA